MSDSLPSLKPPPVPDGVEPMAWLDVHLADLLVMSLAQRVPPPRTVMYRLSEGLRSTIRQLLLAACGGDGSRADRVIDTFTHEGKPLAEAFLRPRESPSVTAPEAQTGPVPPTASRTGFALNLAGLIIHGDGTRETVSELGWTDLTPEQLARIALVLADNDPYYTIHADDVGAAVLHAFGATWQVVNFMGRITRADVGKRVYRIDTPGGFVLSVESDHQRAARQAR